MIPNDWDQQVMYTAKCYELFQEKLGLEPWQVYFNVLEIPTFARAEACTNQGSSARRKQRRAG